MKNHNMKILDFRKGRGGMRKSITILIIFCVVLTGYLVWGGDLSLREAYLSASDKLTLKKESLSQESLGRFQAIRVNDLIISILDTKEGHLWTWSIKTIQGEGPEFFYQGQATSCTRRQG